MDDAETMVFYRAVQEFINRLNCCVVFAISNYSLNMLNTIERFGAVQKFITNLTNSLPENLTYDFITLQDESEAGHNVLNRYFIVKYM